MSYTKLPGRIDGVSRALRAVLPATATAATRSALRASGVGVQFAESSGQAWAACVVQDNPDTVAVELLTVVIGARGGKVLYRPSGKPVAQVRWASIAPDIIDRHGIDAVRRQQLLFALGEDAGEFDTDDAATARAKRQHMAECSIRTLISAIDQVSAPAADIL